MKNVIVSSRVILNGRRDRFFYSMPHAMRTALIISCRSLTDDQRDVDAVVERQTGEKSAEGEGPEGIRARGSD